MTSRPLCFILVMLLVAGPACGGGSDASGPGPVGAAALSVRTEPSPAAQSRLAIVRQPEVQLVDAAGRASAKAGVEVTASLIGGPAVLAGTLVVRSDTAGIAHFQGLSLQGHVGQYRIVFTATGLLPDTSAVLVLNAGNPTRFTLSGPDTTGFVPVGGAVPGPPTFHLTDADSNGVRSANILLRLLAGVGSLPANVVTTNGNGDVTTGTWIVGNLVGIQALEARLANSTTLVDTVFAPVYSGSPVLITPIAGDHQLVVVNHAVPLAPRVRVTDVAGHLKTGVSVVFAPANASAGQVTGATQSTDASGEATLGGWTVGTAAGTGLLTVTAPGTCTCTGTLTAQVLPDVPAGVQLVPPLTDTLFAPTGYGLAAPAVEVRDQYGNLVPGAAVSFTVDAGSVDLPVATSDSLGRARPGLWHLGPLPGPQHLTASAGGGQAVQLAIAHPGRLLLKVAGDSQVVVVGQAVPVAPTVRVTDSAGTPVPGVPVQFFLGARGGSYAGPASVRTDALGEAAGPGWTAGTVVAEGAELRASSIGLAGDTATFIASLLPGPPARWANGYGPTSGLVNQQTPLFPTAQIVDQYGNGVPGLSLSWTVTQGAGSVTTRDSLTRGDGYGQATWILGTVAGPNKMVLSSPALPDSIHYAATGIAGPADSVYVVSGGGQSASVRQQLLFPVMFGVLDPYGNKVANQLVTMMVTAGGGSLGTTSGLTDLNGTVNTGTWTLGPTRGTQTVRASAAGVFVDVDATALPAAPASLVLAGGSGQSVRAGVPSPMPVGVRVLDSNGYGVEGDTVHFTVTAGGGTLTGTSVVTDTGGIARATGWTLGLGSNQLQASLPALAAQVAQASATGLDPTQNYDILLVPVNPLSPEVQAAFDAGIARWRSLILGDEPDVQVSLPANTCFTGQPAFTGLVDDLVLFVLVAPIDGPGGILGGTGICSYRFGSLLPSSAAIILDSADLTAYGSLLPDVVLHEMGHALGIGSIWQSRSLLTGAGGVAPRYTGAMGRAGYWAIRGGQGTSAATVPVEGNASPVGSRDSHWEEATFDQELMTPYADTAHDPLSLLTAASLIDLGYEVDLAAADLGFSLLRAGPPSGPQLPRGWERVFSGPIPPGLIRPPRPPQ